MPIGIAKGLAVTNDWGSDIDRLYKREEYKANIMNQREQKAQYYANLLKRGHGSNPRAELELNDFYKGLNNQLADFVIENPNFQTDVSAMQKFNDIASQYLENPILQRDQQVKQEFDKLRQAYSTKQITKSQYYEEMKRYNEYIDPANAGKDNAYVFSNPKTYTATELLKNANDYLQPTETGYLDKNTHQWMTRKATPQANIIAAAQAQYSDPDMKSVIDNEYNSLITANPAIKGVPGFDNPVSYWAKRIEYGEPVEDAFRTWDYEWQKGVEQAAKGTQNYAFCFTNRLQSLRGLVNAKNDDGTVNPYGEITADATDIALTGFGEKGGTMVITPKAGAMVYDNDAQSYVRFDENVNAKALGASKIVNWGGILYLKTDVSFDSGYTMPGMGMEPVPVISDAKMKRWGFNTSQSVRSDIDLSTGKGSPLSIQKGLTSTGTIMVPLEINENTMTQWDKQYLGTEHAKDIAPFYTENAQNIIQQNSTVGLSEMKRKYPGLADMQYNDELTQKYRGQYNEPFYTAYENGKEIAIGSVSGRRFEINR